MRTIKALYTRGVIKLIDFRELGGGRMRSVRKAQPNLNSYQMSQILNLLIIMFVIQTIE